MGRGVIDAAGWFRGQPAPEPDRRPDEDERRQSKAMRKPADKAMRRPADK